MPPWKCSINPMRVPPAAGCLQLEGGGEAQGRIIGGLTGLRFCFLSTIFLVLYAANALSVLAVTADDTRFRLHEAAYAYMDCSACLAFAGYLGNRMNSSLKYREPVDSPRSITKKPGDVRMQQRHSYAFSELRVAEVLDKVCNDELIDNYALRFSLGRRIRVYSADGGLPFAQHYSLQDAKTLKKVEGRAVFNFCVRVMSEEEEDMTDLVGSVDLLSDLELRLCGGTFNLNDTDAPFIIPHLDDAITDVCIGIESSFEAEVRRLERYEQWHKDLSEGKATDDAFRGVEGQDSVMVRKMQYTNDDELSFTVLRRPSRKKEGNTSGGNDSASDNESDNVLPVNQPVPINLNMDL
ncbi:hypothetical protein TRVL_05261 [Trypanosoma vivax]|uniref:DUF3456 domain-containing protein n=1 Tax=Trypanosoma vivax (strain Y486) TaxID=1055687 RepID=G0U936_TRYVY|nr:hypothetical protein TRVL_05261 [Trypanosoma vivax]CCC54120.1 conserved hypothetical protein [Trypanosoma vivax Y486]